MEFKYYRDLKHNYLVFDRGSSGAASENKYQYKIMESGRIKGLVPCSGRNINGEQYFYYEVGSMQPIKDRFCVSKMKYEQIMELLSDAKALLEELSEFLLGEEGVVFNSKCIFTDLSKGGNRFIYCPFFDENMSFSDFAMELLDLADPADEKAMELAYALCEEASAPGAMTLGILDKFLSLRREPEPQSVPVSVYIPEEPEDEPLQQAPPVKRNNGLRKSDRKLGGKMQILFSFLFACVLGAMFYIRMNYILSSEENILSIIVMMISVITGVVAFVGGILDMKRQKEGKVSDKPADYREFPDDSFDEEYDELGGDDGMEEFRQLEERGSYNSPINVTGATYERPAYPEQSCGETMVLDQERSGELTLFSRNLDRTVRIGLGRLPVTIGKMEGCVDRVISDNSVSRIHCRLEEQGGRISIEDLGSTNGTYRNGLRLNPREKTYIDEGDEIRIGRVCFDCR